VESRRLSIPIYLNQRVVFDLLAIVEEGFSQLQTIKTSETGKVDNKVEGTADVGLKNAFAFLSLGLKASGAHQATSGTQRDITEERVFTPTSLFSRLRDTLMERKLLHSLDDKYDPTALVPGNFVEFSGVLHKNPLVANMDIMVQMMEMAMVLSPATTDGTAKKGAKARPDDAPIKEMKKVQSMLTQSGTLDLVAKLSQNPSMQAVLPVQLEYFANGSPASIIDGQFMVVGKVTRFVSSDDQGGIDLLRGTPLAHLPEELLVQMTSGFAAFGSMVSGVEQFTTRIPGPALLVIPIAIYA
jgi:hypothetical protein